MPRTIDATGLTPDQRRYVAATLYQWWRVGGPTGPLATAFSGHTRTRRAGDMIDEGVAKYPDIIRRASTAVKARIDRFREWRATPTLQLTQYGPRFTVRKYDVWGVYQGTGEPKEEYRHCGTSYFTIGHLERNPRWDDHDFKTAENWVKSGRYPVGAYEWEPVPDWLKTAVRDYARISKRETLIPTKSEIQRYRKACGLVKPRAKKTAIA